LPDALLIIASGLRAGTSLPQALQQLGRRIAAAPVAGDRPAAARARLGVTLDDALEHLQARVPLASLTLAASAMRIAAETGGQLAEDARCARRRRCEPADDGSKIRA
jgi:tight adherence protein B